VGDPSPGDCPIPKVDRTPKPVGWHGSRIKRISSYILIAIFLLSISGCANKDYTSADRIGVKWELISNFIDVENAFEAKFTIKNSSDIKLTNSNWALFFHVNSRPIIENKTAQPASVQHINGDWFKLVPEKKFSLKPGETIDILYRSENYLIKESDTPLGPYFVFYNDKGEEEDIVQVADFSIVPVTKPEQINRGKKDEEPIPSPELRYNSNLSSKEIASSKLQNIIPSPVSFHINKGAFEVKNTVGIHYQDGLENEAKFLARKLRSLTGTNFKISNAPAKGKAITLKFGKVKTEGIKEEAYKLDITVKGISITGNKAAGVFYGIQSMLALVPLEVYKSHPKTFNLWGVNIIDAPRFGFRSIHVDVCRNFQTKETIKRILDILASYKVNRFLFYTTEDEGWRVEIDGLPELTAIGGQREHATEGMDASFLHPSYGSGPVAYEKGKHGSGYYTREDFIEILKYAKERHIKVIPELNFPGHARAAIKPMEARYERKKLMNIA
jgi:hexosaminidase